MFLASTSREDALEFARDTFGPVISGEIMKSEELLATLECFLRCERNVRDCADELGVHPNTVRYRLTNIERVARLSITTDDNDYMMAQIAMTVIRLNGMVATFIS
jgi:DNA-binding PucR family transcriptional regulator